MKCGLVQILAVVIVLGYTILAPGFNLSGLLNSVEAGNEHLLDDTSLLDLEHEVYLDTLSTDDIIQQINLKISSNLII